MTIALAERPSQALGPYLLELNALVQDAARVANCSIDMEALQRLAVAVTTPGPFSEGVTAQDMMRLLRKVLEDPRTIGQLNAVAIALRERPRHTPDPARFPPALPPPQQFPVLPA
jgi:hypothetical protein